MAGIDDVTRITEILDAIMANVGTKPRTTYYVDSSNGNDNYDGLSRERPFHSINAAILASTHGDTIHIARDTYDEAVDVVAGHIGLHIICEPGVYIVNTTPGTAVQINSAAVYWQGGIIEQNGQVGMQVNDQWFIGKDIRVYNCTIGFDMNSEFPVLINCRTNECSASGFDIAEDSGHYIDCACQGAAASRGFYLSHTNAHNNIILRGATLGCTAAGYECVAGADENLFARCSQSSLCAGPTNAGANNTWTGHSTYLDRIKNLTRPQNGTQATTNVLTTIGSAITDTIPFKVQGTLSLDLMQAGDTFLVIEEIRDQDDATWREYGRVTYNGVQTSPMVWFEEKVCQGWRIRIQRTAGADRNVTYQFFTEVASA